MQIYKNRLYALAYTPHDCRGFYHWGEEEQFIVTGYKARNERPYVVAEFKPQSGQTFALHDGHVPEHRPIADSTGLVAWFEENPYQFAELIK